VNPINTVRFFLHFGDIINHFLTYSLTYSRTHYRALHILQHLFVTTTSINLSSNRMQTFCYPACRGKWPFNERRVSYLRAKARCGRHRPSAEQWPVATAACDRPWRRSVPAAVGWCRLPTARASTDARCPASCASGRTTATHAAPS